MKHLPALLCTSTLACSSYTFALDGTDSPSIEEMLVTGNFLFQDTQKVSPRSTITAADFSKINVTTVEDIISHEPSLIVRKRFIGDPNGVIGIRGSNMFQTTRSMVFVDGMPIHYHLQTRWNGAPRWSLVSTGEISQAEVFYGPFSAEYSGNAMGGVVEITTKEPTSQKVSLEGAIFSQSWDRLATSEDYQGHKLFTSYENVFGDLSVFTSYNRLRNESQPMTFFETRNSTNLDGVSGALPGLDDRGNDTLYVGDSGSEIATTDQFKIKLQYDFGNHKLRANVVTEQREREETGRNNYLTDEEGNLFFESFESDFQNQTGERESLLVGLGLGGALNETWAYDAFYSNFQILKDEEIRSGANPADPTFESRNASFRGRLTEFDDTGWQILDFKAGTESLFGHKNMRLSVGFHEDLYELEVNPVNLNNITGERGTPRSSSGGKTSTTALFAQYGYGLSSQWDISVGLRFEDWEARDGFVGIRGNDTFINVPDRSESGFSPKFSLAFLPSEAVEIRYSLARAIRFPIVDELFRFEQTDVSRVTPDANLAPEEGIFQNVGFSYNINTSEFAVNVFYEVIDDTIFNFTATENNVGITSALQVDEVTTSGIEFVYNTSSLFGSKLNSRINIVYTDAEITENRLNEDIVGKQFPRLPYWRSNLILGYPILENIVDISTSLRYASNSFGTLDNTDTASNVFGAHDSFLFWGAKTNWKVNNNFDLSFGIDNITDEEVYVHHPWPARTMYLEGKVSF